MLRQFLASATRWLPLKLSSRNDIAYEALPGAPRDEVARRVLRKIDTRLIPLLFITYMLNFMDKTILSSASVFGIKEDTGLKGQEYSWVSSVFLPRIFPLDVPDDNFDCSATNWQISGCERVILGHCGHSDGRMHGF